MGTIPASTGTAGWFGHSGNSLAAALGVKDRDFPLGVLSTTHCAWDGRVRLTHRADGLEDFLAILANVFVNRHKLPLKK